MLRVKQAQIISEYALTISLVILIMVTMFTLVKRSTQKLSKLAADRIGFQNNADQDFNSEKRGYLVSTVTQSNKVAIHDEWYVPGYKGDTYNDSTQATVVTYSNQGFTSPQQDVVTNSVVDLPTTALP